MKSKFLLPFLASIFLTAFYSVGDSYAQSRLGLKVNFVPQETRELNKLKSSGITLRTTFAKLLIAGNVEPTKAEELLLNEKGQPVEKKTFTSYGSINERIEYKYNPKGVLIKKTTFNGENVVTEKEETKVDKNGKTLEILAETLVRNTLHKTRRVMAYDKKGHLIETKGFEKGKNFVLKEVCEYKGDLQISRKTFNFDGQFLNSEEYEYDSQNKRTKELVTNIRTESVRDSVTLKPIVKAYKEILEFNLSYNEKGNLAEIKGPDYKQVLTYNDNGDFTRDIVYDKKGTRQNDNEYTYDEKGFLKRVTRYYADGKPGAYIDYTYETKKLK